MNRTLIAVLALCGCGLPNESDGVAAARDEAAVTVAHPAPHHAAPRDTLTFHERQPSPGALGVTLTGLPQTGHLFAVAGMLSCGFLEVGRADGELVNGAVTLNLPLEPFATGERWSIFFYVDDGDGQCTTETVQSAKLPALPASGVLVDASTLQASYGAGCWAFQ